MNDRQRIEKSVEALDLFITDMNNGNGNNLSDHKHTLWLIFFENEQFSNVFKDKIPIDKLGKFASELRQFVMNPMSSSDQYQNYAMFLTRLKTVIIENCKLKNFRIFYSWQSDLPNNTNRSFIQNAIQDAIEELNEENHWELFIDQDTRGECGSPDIANTILKKIDNSDIFIADVTAISNKEQKLIPNPNVLFELGYSFKSVGDGKVIMVCNIAYGDVENLPFDLGLKRQLIYNCKQDEQEKSKIRKELKDQLKRKSQEIVKNN